MKVNAPFVASTSVRSDATFESVKIFRDEMEKYRNGISEDDLQFIKNCMILSNALGLRQTDRWWACSQRCQNMGFLMIISRMRKSVIKDMTVEEHKAITDKYIVPDKMYYVIVGDAATQLNHWKR